MDSVKQASLFARDEGMAQVLQAGGQWADVAADLLVQALKQHPEGALMETCRQWALEQGLPHPHHPNAWGAVVALLARTGRIERTGAWHRAGSLKSHAHHYPAWRVKQ